MIFKIPLLALILSLSFSVYAFGVSVPYTLDKPLEISPGETKLFDLNLQNMIGNEEYLVQTSFVNDGDIASFVSPEEVYKIPPRTEDFLIPIQVRMPKKAIPGDIKEISIKISRVTESAGEGMVVLVGGMTIRMSVKVIEEEMWPKSRFHSLMILSLILVLLLLILVFVILFRKRKLRISHKIHKRRPY